ncbi:unnamed protein product [Musa acuminata subsp. malaccensis]|uniref:(wild Malaysian banana) hypothetical protein n=1 Tax=Musa acuminata subsp. malaccensis TaxID=214687 RepID=A0A8D7AEM9_MUSAM|nr:unnamed protein product [Musa acuminata subsp. malaccensis]
MFFKHNEQNLVDDKASQLANEQLQELDCDGHLASADGISSSRAISEESPSSDRLLDILDSKKDVAHLASKTSFPSIHGNSCLLPVMSIITDRVLSEQSKRPFSDDEVYLLACKRLKQVDKNVYLDSYAEVQFRESLTPSSGSLVVPNDHLKNSDASRHVDHFNKVTGRNQFISNPDDEEAVLGSPVGLDSLSSYYENYHHTIGLCQADEFLSPAFDYFPRKPVAIGANHQADVPEWSSHSCKKIGDCGHCASPLVYSTVCHLVNDDDSEKWIHSCIIPMPESSLLASEIRDVLHKTDCSCLDESSVRCISQHVKEAREKLKKFLGQDMFERLGLCDMGEDVACKWTIEEEHLFQEVVLSNPESLGKNFWDVLPYFFPARSSKELVSYYFNVFMLRKRAEQNRLDPSNVDSDDDEWQGSDDDEFAAEEENEEDSIVESVADADADAATCNRADHEDIKMNEDHEGGDELDEHAIVGENEGASCFVSEGYNIDKPNFVPPKEPMDKNLQNSVVEQDVQDESCTSYEDQHGADSCGLSETVDVQHCLIDGL